MKRAFFKTTDRQDRNRHEGPWGARNGTVELLRHTLQAVQTAEETGYFMGGHWNSHLEKAGVGRLRVATVRAGSENFPEL